MGGHVLMMMRPKVPFWYTHIEKEWVPNELPPINTDFRVSERIYRIAPSSLHGLGIFSMDGIKFSYNKVIELMDFVGPWYDYSGRMQIVRYKKSMYRYALEKIIYNKKLVNKVK